MMRKAILLGTALAVFASANVFAAKEYYKWTDEKGVTHYSARKPHGQEAEVIRVSTGQRVAGSESTASAGNAPAAATSEQADEANSGLKDPERCEAAQENLEILRSSSRVRMRGDDGEIRYLSDAEKAEKVSEFQKAMDESC